MSQLPPHQIDVLQRLLKPDSGASENERDIARRLLDRQQTVAEIASMAECSTAYFVGVWPDPYTKGHYCRTPDGQLAKRAVTPWTGHYGDPITDGVCMKIMGATEQYGAHMQPEGVRFHQQKEGWTLVCWWDRSGDPRKGCVAGFALKGSYNADQAEAEARRLFPLVFSRIDRHLGRSTDAQELRALVIRRLAEANQEEWERVAVTLGVK